MDACSKTAISLPIVGERPSLFRFPKGKGAAVVVHGAGLVNMRLASVLWTANNAQRLNTARHPL